MKMAASIAMRPDARPEAPMSLRELQSRVQAAILDGDDSILAIIPGNSRTDAATLFGVYRHAYRARLVEILSNDYPLSRAFLGEGDFERQALRFVNLNPSRTTNARWFGARFPEHLATRQTSIELKVAAELAAIERALADAFDAADGDVIGLEELARIPVDDWGRLKFTPHGTCTRLELETNAFDMWLALKDDETPPPPAVLADEVILVVWRQGTRPLVRAMGYEEAMIWAEAGNGVPFGILCEMAATFDDASTAAIRVAGYLQGWLVAGLLNSAVVGPARPEPRD